MKTLKKINFLVLLVLLAMLSFAQDGQIDSNFGMNGIAVTALGTDSIHAQAGNILLQPDGKIISMGNVVSGDGTSHITGRWVILRHLPNGTLDNSFATSGKLVVQLPNVVGTATWDGAIQNDGKIVLVGIEEDSLTHNGGFGVIRLNPNGSLDSTFNGTGNQMKICNRGIPSFVKIQPDQKILIEGVVFDTLQQTHSSLVRLNTNGSIDSSFGKNGLFVYSQDTISHTGSMLLLASGKIMLAGLSSPSNAGGVTSKSFILRLNTNGSLDSSFAVNGRVIAPIMDTAYPFSYMKLLLNGKLLAAGSALNNGKYGFAIAQYNLDGTPDLSFGTSGRVLSFLPFSVNTVRGLDVQPDGKIIVLSYNNDTTNVGIVLSRFNINGSIDSTFGNNGWTASHPDGQNRCGGYRGLAIDNNGKIVVAGYSYNQATDNGRFLLARYNTHCSNCMWPGDADNNNVVDNTDLLPIGLAYDSMGTSRLNQSIVWQLESSVDWVDTFSTGVNFKHADCNGNGTINADDTLAIVKNFGYTHAKKENERGEWRAGLPALSVVFSKDTLKAGDTLIASIQLGDASLPASNIYGIAFTYNYDVKVVDTSMTSIRYPASWLGTTTEKISIQKDFKDVGQLKTAVTRINHFNRSGFGEIAQISFKITTDNISGKDLSYYNNLNFISDITAIDSSGKNIDLNAGVDSAMVAFTPNSIENIELLNATIRAFPNPASNKLSITSSLVVLHEINLINVLGEKMITQKSNNEHSVLLDISAIANGVYFLQIETDNGTINKRVVIQK